MHKLTVPSPIVPVSTMKVPELIALCRTSTASEVEIMKEEGSFSTVLPCIVGGSKIWKLTFIVSSKSDFHH